MTEHRSRNQNRKGQSTNIIVFFRKKHGQETLEHIKKQAQQPERYPAIYKYVCRTGIPVRAELCYIFFASSSGMNLQNITPPQAKPNAAYAAHRAKELISILQPPLPQYRPPHSGLCRRAALHASFPPFVCRPLSSTLPKPLRAHSQHVSKAREM